MPAYIANYVGVAIAELIVFPLTLMDGPAIFAVLNPIMLQETIQRIIDTEKALTHAMRSIRLSVEHALEQERYERQMQTEHVKSVRSFNNTAPTHIYSSLVAHERTVQTTGVHL